MNTNEHELILKEKVFDIIGCIVESSSNLDANWNEKILFVKEYCG